MEHVTINNFPVGRSVDETLRTLQAVQFVAEHGEVCPAGWHPGDKTMVADADRALDYFETVAEAGEVRLHGMAWKASPDSRLPWGAARGGEGRRRGRLARLALRSAEPLHRALLTCPTHPALFHRPMPRPRC